MLTHVYHVVAIITGAIYIAEKFGDLIWKVARIAILTALLAALCAALLFYTHRPEMAPLRHTTTASFDYAQHGAAAWEFFRNGVNQTAALLGSLKGEL